MDILEILQKALEGGIITQADFDSAKTSYSEMKTKAEEGKFTQEDLNRADIFSKWWIINSSFYGTDITNKVLKAKASNEVEWINKVNEISNGNFALIKWTPGELKGENLSKLLK